MSPETEMGVVVCMDVFTSKWVSRSFTHLLFACMYENMSADLYESREKKILLFLSGFCE